MAEKARSKKTSPEVTKPKKEHLELRKLGQDIYSATGILLQISFAFILIALAAFVFITLYTQFQAVIIIPTVVIGILAYLAHLYINRIDKLNDRVIFLEGKIKGYENKEILEDLLKREK